MRILIVSDIHSNIVAFEAVLAAADQFDDVWCLGDIIGYGPAPNDCVEMIRPRANEIIIGNHDLACLGKVDLDDFNPDARRANEWNGRQLKDTNRSWLERLNPRKQIDERFTIAHGSPREPVWEYLLTCDEALENGAYFDTQVCFIGHSHVQLFFRLASDGHCTRTRPHSGDVLDLNTPGERFIINPGSVGQPRDYDRRAAYAILDTDAGLLEFHRVEYDIQKTQQQMREAKLPFQLVRRLEHGM
ncbi:MAG: metallophosphatase family protein [Chloroflexaceae bacterium]|jgi:diadenosine tetraphosphatase ApaH/serine/threonine PP2A family protein phosphatase|nr:metallophosphatase family protein [Chloroflexaceae bacterium]